MEPSSTRPLTAIAQLGSAWSVRVTSVAVVAVLVSLPVSGHPGNVAHASARNAAAPGHGVVIRPGQSWNAAYQNASCGQVISLAAGTHPSQTIFEDRALSACAKPVTFQPVPGAAVTVNGYVVLGNGDCHCYTNDVPDQLVLRGFKYTKMIWIYGDARNVVLDGVDGGGLLLQGVNGVTVRNSDFGPCDSSGPRWCDRIFIQDTRGTDPAPTQNILFENNKVHDYKQVTAADHWECMFTTGGTNVTIRRNKFWNCQLYAIALGERANSDYVNWIIENNWFGRSSDVVNGERASAINFGDGPVSDILIRFNTFIRGQGVVQEGRDVGANNRVVRNILTHTSCIRGIRYGGNLFTGGTCSVDDRSAVYGYRFDGARLRVDGPRGKATQAAYASVARGTPLRNAARILARAPWPSPPGGWNARTLRGLLADEVYLGRRLGWQHQHAALVSGSRWRRVQRVLEGKVPRRR